MLEALHVCSQKRVLPVPSADHFNALLHHQQQFQSTALFALRCLMPCLVHQIEVIAIAAWKEGEPRRACACRDLCMHSQGWQLTLDQSHATRRFEYAALVFDARYHLDGVQGTFSCHLVTKQKARTVAPDENDNTSLHRGVP